MNFKKTLLATLTTFMVGGVVLSANQNTSLFEPQAATTETNRIWVVAGAWWTNDGAETYLYAWKNSDSTAFVEWPGFRLINPSSSNTNLDNANSTYYVDVPTTYDRFKLNRVQPGTTNVWNESPVNNTIDGNTKNYKFEINGTAGINQFQGLTVNSFTANTTTLVTNLSQSIDTNGEACSNANAQTAINTYNGLATFDQDQFDALDVGGGVTGLQRLQYLKDFYSIATALN
jgi:hypothetical protein